MSTTKKRQRKAFNRVVQTLSELYNMPYYEVMAIYKSQEKNLDNTRSIINLKQMNHESISI